jgi:hypothetical protein
MLELPLPLSLIAFCRLRCQWMCNGHMDFWNGDGGSQVFTAVERYERASNDICQAGYNAMH